MKFFLSLLLALLLPVTVIADEDLAYTKSAGSIEIVSPAGCLTHYDNDLDARVLDIGEGCEFELYGVVPDLTDGSYNSGIILVLTYSSPNTGSPGTIIFEDAIALQTGAIESTTDNTNTSNWSPTITVANDLYVLSVILDVRQASGTGLSAGSTCSDTGSYIDQPCKFTEFKIRGRAGPDITGSDLVQIIGYSVTWTQDE